LTIIESPEILIFFQTLFNLLAIDSISNM